MEKIRIIELFAGVGGFRIGLERASRKFQTVWSNQWEPGTKNQVASKVYVERFGKEGHCNQDISKVKVKDIPAHDLLVGGFPCQDYSVATTLKNSKGLHGKKGVLWWEIYRILEESRKPAKYLFLENVDRLLKSPAKQRGRDFAVMLASLNKLGYIVEWRVINAAEYGMPQRRRRIFILGYHRSTTIYKQIKKQKNDLFDLLYKNGTIASAFPVMKGAASNIHKFKLDPNIKEVSDNFNRSEPGTLSPFENTGIMIDGVVHTCETKPNYSGPYAKLGDIVLRNGSVREEYYIDKASLPKWKYLKGAKNEVKTNKAQGFQYRYSEGAMVFPDPLDKPSRTIITGEGGSTPSRFKHVIQTDSGRLRRLMPEELEMLNMFPKGHTAGATDIKRAFMMGNALVVGVVEGIGCELVKRIK